MVSVNASGLNNVFMYRIFVVIFLSLIFVSRAEAKIYVVSVGISNYKNIGNLNSAERDAKSISMLYKKQTDAVILITGKYATKRMIVKSLEDQFSRASADDMIVFFFSGHGYRGGICPYDMTRDLRSGLSYGEIKKLFRRFKAKKKVIIADSCFSGGLRNDNQQNERAESDSQLDVIFFLSSRGGEYSAESPLMANGLFTTALIEGLRGCADTNQDRCVTAQEIFVYVSKKLQQRCHGKQHPVMWGHFDDSFMLMDWR